MTRVSHLTLLAILGLFNMACGSRTETPRGPSGPETAGLPMPAVHPVEHASPLPATSGPGFTIADVRFMQTMIGHHAQAITMAVMAPGHGASETVRRLAQKIEISQRDEIEMMTRWLTERQQAVPDSVHSHTMVMPGMLTPERLAQLDAARGRAFDRLFLAFMISHHEGALRMVEDLFRSPGAAHDLEIFRFATDVDADQRDEIFVMQSLLDTYGNPAP